MNGTKRTISRVVAMAAAAATCLATAGLSLAPAASAGIVNAGNGSYTTENVGQVPGAACNQDNLRAYLSTDAPNKPVPTNDWWTSLVFKFSDASGTQKCSQNHALSALPVQYSIEDGYLSSQYDGDSDIPGVHIAYSPLTTVASVTGKGANDQSFHQYMSKGMVVAQVEGMTAASSFSTNNPAITVTDWSDWTVSTRLRDPNGKTLDATIGEGMPLSWYQASGGNARLRINTWSSEMTYVTGGNTTADPSGASLVVFARTSTAGNTNPNGYYYAAYAPPGATWTRTFGDWGGWQNLTATSGGYFAVAALPIESTGSAQDAWNLARQYQPYAYSPVTNTRADYSYDDSLGTVTTTYSATAQPIANAPTGSLPGTVMALLPHQWRKYAGTADSSFNISQAPTYSSPRGPMKTLIGITSFTTRDTFSGVLTEVPGVATAVAGSNERNRLNSELDSYLAGTSLAHALRDNDTPTYGVGKALGRTARIVEVADQLGRTDVRDKALADIRETLTDWFTAAPGKNSQVLRYTDKWKSLIGYPTDFYADTELNDHHFHYGYYVVAAAVLARFDPTWVSQYGEMVEMMIRDVNSPSRTDSMFPYLRYFDVYAGHDYAAGPGAYDAGNNQESSSEAMNFTYGMMMWGQVTGNKSYRDAGVYMYTTQAAAINEYWFNDSGTALPKGYNDQIVPVVWTNGGTGGLFFGNGQRAYKYGINTLPVTGGFLYLTTSSVSRNYAALQAAPRLSGENLNEWADIHLSALALADGATALSRLDSLGAYSNGATGSVYTNESGSTRAHTYHWIANLTRLGTVDRTVTANYPFATAFTKNDARTYVVSNTSSREITVTFSDCTAVVVAAGRTGVFGAAAGGLSAGLGSAAGGTGLAVGSIRDECRAPSTPGGDGDGSGSGTGGGGDTGGSTGGGSGTGGNTGSTGGNTGGTGGSGTGGSTSGGNTGGGNEAGSGGATSANESGKGAGDSSTAKSRKAVKQRARISSVKIVKGKAGKSKRLRKAIRKRHSAKIRVRVTSKAVRDLRGTVVLTVKGHRIGKAKVKRYGKRWQATVKVKAAKNRWRGVVKVRYAMRTGAATATKTSVKVM
ncbi:glycosyl hydrolase [Rarobacter incanus]|uniref:glucan endo-1,3-beta-D-glucosidase n=1 Tax=Rarobacter incanus TaxID=153494 RepID=A0A542SR65_9MICO|nr:glycosyl hydrolase [Rarobacter incanus]TQK77102.1 endoglucanase Acf2 [Rarobacter incanus]